MSYTIPNMLLRFVGCVPSSLEPPDLTSMEASTETYRPEANFSPPVQHQQQQTIPIPIQRPSASSESIRCNIPNSFNHNSFLAFPDRLAISFASVSSTCDVPGSFENFTSSPPMGVGLFDPMSPISMEDQYQHESYNLPSSYSSSATTAVDYPSFEPYDGVPVLMNQDQIEFSTHQSKLQTTLSLLPVLQVRQHPLHRCPHCTHVSNRGNNMKEHILTHDPNRPKKFKCDVCNKLFARKHDMKRHIRTHERRNRSQRLTATGSTC